jgi:heme a synthase
MLFIIAWGTFVRATGSGAGCGNHWPLCNGEALPRSPTMATVIEFMHRVTGALGGLPVLLQVYFARRVFKSGHPVRWLSWLTLVLFAVEGAIGAGLVKFEVVASDASIARAYWMSAHLINTFLLVGVQTLIIWASKHDEVRLAKGRQRAAWLTGTALFALLLTGVSGAVAALGDTLFPAKTLAEGFAADRAADAHVFVELRVLHPFVAAGTAIHLLIVASSFVRSGDPATRQGAQRTGLLVLAQVAAGIVNLLLLAPIAMQVVHLLLADLVWMSVVTLTADALKESATSPRSARERTSETASSTA